jgi:hypothetical protein
MKKYSGISKNPREFIERIEYLEPAEINLDDLKLYRRYFGALNNEERQIIPQHTRDNVNEAFRKARERVYQLMDEGKKSIEWPGGGICHVQGYDKGGRKTEVTKWEDIPWNIENVKRQARRLQPLPDVELDSKEPEPIGEVVGRVAQEQGVPF